MSGRERKKSHEKIYPKGYVEMLEQQQGQLVQGLQAMYHRMLAAQLWQGPALSEVTGHPLTHNILSALGLLEKKHDGSDETIPFEEDTDKLQACLIADGAVMTKRRASLSSDSESSQHAHASSHRTTVLSKPTLFEESFSSGTPSPSSPTARSPAPKQRKTQPLTGQSPLRQNAPMMNNDPQLYQMKWAQTLSDPDAILKANFMMKQPLLQPSAYDLQQDFTQEAMIDSPMTSEFDFGDVLYSQLTTNGGFGSMPDFGYVPKMPACGSPKLRLEEGPGVDQLCASCPSRQV